MINKDMYYSAMKRIKLYPTEEQKQFIDKCIEGYRIVYNWSIDQEYNQFNLYNEGKTDRSFLSKIDLQNMYKSFRLSNELLSELPTHSMLNSVNDMVAGYESFFRHKNLFNKPSYKNNDSLYSSYKPRNEPTSFYFNRNMVRVEGLKYMEMIKTSYDTGNIPSDRIKYINPIIFRNNRTGEYFLNYVLLKPKLDGYFIENNIPISDPIGVDINKKIMFACSNGMMVNYVDTSRIEVHLAQVSKQVQRDRDRYNEILKQNPEQQMSGNSLFRLEKRKKLYERLSNIHKDTAYKGALLIVRLRPKAIILENLEIKKIMSHKYIADDLQFHPLGIARDILVETANKYNIPVIFAPVRFESSNYCSNCGSFKNIGSNKYFVCDKCGAKIQRDLNAAINLQKWYLINFE